MYKDLDNLNKEILKSILPESDEYFDTPDMPDEYLGTSWDEDGLPQSDSEHTTSILGITTKLNILPLEGQITEEELKNDLRVGIYKGYLPAWYEFPALAQKAVFALSLIKILPDFSGNYHLPKGVYSYYVRGAGYYSIIKVFIVNDEDVKLGTKDLIIETGAVGGKGYEPNPFRKAGEGGIPATAQVKSQDVITCLWSDEVYQYFTSQDLGNDAFPYIPFTTPFFTKERAMHEFTSQQEFIQYLEDIQGGNMHIFNLGKSPVYDFDIPLLLFTTHDVSSLSLKGAANVIRADEKPVIWYQAQIHANEVAAGEGALAIIADLQGEFGAEVLQYVNIIVVPRINVDSSFIFSRYNGAGIDMNRDHMALTAIELAYVHDAFIKFMPDLAMDAHEFVDFLGYLDHPLNLISSGPRMKKMNTSEDLQIDPANSLNNDPAVTALGIDIVNNIFNEAKGNGLRTGHYGISITNVSGRIFYSLYNTISVLIESRGIGAGSTAFARRVYTQTVAVKSMFRYACEHGAEIKAAVAAARQKTIEKGKCYDEADLLVLKHGKSGNTLWPDTLPRVTYDVYGNAYHDEADLVLDDVIERGRPRPTGYAFSLNEPWVDKAIYRFDHQGIEYYKLAPGTSLPLQQYYYEGPAEKGFTAALHEAAEVTFPDGAVFIPMDQVAATVTAMMMEPDVNDSDGYNATFVQSGILDKDEEGNYPLYRYILDDPRTTLGLGKAPNK